MDRSNVSAEGAATKLANVNVAEFTEAVFGAVLRAADARKAPGGRVFPGPILWGIWWWPEGGGPLGPLNQPEAGGVLASELPPGARPTK